MHVKVSSSDKVAPMMFGCGDSVSLDWNLTSARPAVKWPPTSRTNWLVRANVLVNKLELDSVGFAGRNCFQRNGHPELDTFKEVVVLKSFGDTPDALSER